MTITIVQEVKVTRNYQITIPKAIAERARIKVGDKIIVIYDGKEIVLKRGESIKRLNGILTSRGKSSDNLDYEIREAIDELVNALDKEIE